MDWTSWAAAAATLVAAFLGGWAPNVVKRRHEKQDLLLAKRLRWVVDQKKLGDAILFPNPDEPDEPWIYEEMGYLVRADEEHRILDPGFDPLRRLVAARLEFAVWLQRSASKRARAMSAEELPSIVPFTKVWDTTCALLDGWARGRRWTPAWRSAVEESFIFSKARRAKAAHEASLAKATNRASSSNESAPLDW